MKKLELILNIVGIISSLTVSLNVSGTAEICILSLLALSMLYYLFSFALLSNIPFRKLFKKASYKGISALRIIGSILFGFAISPAVIGVLFATMGYKGAYEMLLIGGISMGIAVLPVLYKYIQQRGIFYQGVIIRSIIWGGLVVAFLLAS